jgi:hypothetical protein
MNVYLAGKVDDQFGSWRDSILGTEMGLDGAGQVIRNAPIWQKYYTQDDYDDNRLLIDWKPIPDAVLGLHTYTGPFRQVASHTGWPEKWLGEAHGITTSGQHGEADPECWAHIVGACCRAIEASDLVFAYINNPDAYGTVAEIGYAVARSKFVSVLIGRGVPFEGDDFRFVETLAPHCVNYWEVSGASEGERCKAALKDAFVAYSAWREKMGSTCPMPARVNPTAQLVIDSLLQITQWTSDPRVRGEAQRVLRVLTNR